MNSVRRFVDLDSCNNGRFKFLNASHAVYVDVPGKKKKKRLETNELICDLGLKFDWSSHKWYVLFWYISNYQIVEYDY